MGKIEQALALAREMAADPSHGYDQTRRWGPDYDCSSFIITVWESVGVPVKTRGATYTGNMRPAFLAAGFTDVTEKITNMATGAGIAPGDVLLNIINHTAMALGGGQIIQAAGNERGGITGGAPGDQTGGESGVYPWVNYPWDCVLRYTGENAPAPAERAPQPDAATYAVQSGDTLWSIAGALYGDNARWRTLAELNGLAPPYSIYVGQLLKTGAKPEAETEPAGRYEKFAADYPAVYAALRERGILP